VSILEFSVSVFVLNFVAVSFGGHE
jgi:hypothetical protein